MKRIANYRSGDRSEALGVPLMQLFCAVAPVPTTEDFGLFDATATILRREGRMLYAEDSFLVQSKARTATVVEYTGMHFRALLDQDLSFFIAHVDLAAAEIKLYSLHRAISHPNIRDLKGLIVHLTAVPQQNIDGVLHTSLGEPVLRWTSAQLTDREFEMTAYTVMKQWLELERWNRRCRKMGIQKQINWETNGLPSERAQSFVWHPPRATDALTEIVPAIQLIAQLVSRDVSLAEPVFTLIDWLRSYKVDPDPGGYYRLLAFIEIGRKKLRDALEACDAATIAVHFIPIENSCVEPIRISLWLQAFDRGGSGDAKLHQGTAAELSELGFELEIVSPDRISVGLGQKWLNDKNCVLLDVVDGVFLLQKVANDGTEQT